MKQCDRLVYLDDGNQRVYFRPSDVRLVEKNRMAFTILHLAGQTFGIPLDLPIKVVMDAIEDATWWEFEK